MVFYLNKKINLTKDQYLETSVLGYRLVLYPNRPAWIFLNETEYFLFKLLEKHTIEFSLKQLKKKFSFNKKQSLSIVIKLLERIGDSLLYENACSQEQDDIDSVAKIVHINLTNDCNLRCKHCYMSAGFHPLMELDINKLTNAIHDILKSINVGEFVISGGEPLVYPHLEKLLPCLKNKRVVLFTNGMNLTENNSKLILPYVDEVQISFEGVTKDDYEKIRGVGNFEKALRAVKLVKKYNKKISFAFTILPSGLESFCENLIPFLQNLKYKNIEIRINDVIEQKGNAIKFLNEQFDMLASAKMIGALIQKLKKKGYNVAGHSNQNIRYLNCGIGSSFVINYDGKVYPCSEYSSYHYTIDDNFSLINKQYNEINRNTSVTNIEECGHCELKYICCGMCKVKNLLKNGDMKKPICNKSEKYKELLYEYIKQYGI